MAVEPVFRVKGFADIAEALLESARHPAAGRPALTDSTEGSVVLTLVEAFARELAVCYEQLDIVYRHAYLATAEGAALDNVVALLGIERRKAGYLAGTVEFSRAQPADADITIPARTLVAGAKAPPFETVKETVLTRGSRAVSADVQSVDPGGDLKIVQAKALTVMPRPVSGIETVSNPGQMVQRQQAETDDEMRVRARQTVRGTNTGTVGALEQAVRACGVEGVKVLEELTGAPGDVVVVFDTAGIEPDQMRDTLAQIRARIAAVRPAGVRVSVGPATTIVVRVAATLQLSQELSPADQRDVLARTRAALQDYFSQLSIGETVRAAKVRSVLTGDPRVVAVAAAPEGALLMDPMVDGISVAARSRMTNDDILVSGSERATLDPAAPWPKLALESPGVRIDAILTQNGADPAVGAALRKAVSEALAALVGAKVVELNRAEKAGAGLARESEISFGDLLAAARTPELIAARFTIVHERDGRAVMLSADGDRDSFAPRERPRLGDVIVRVGSANG